MMYDYRYKSTKLSWWAIMAISVTFVIVAPLYNVGAGILDNKYFPLMVMIGLSPFVILFNGYKADKKFWLLLFILFLMFVNGKLLHPQTFRVSSYIYTIGFFLLYLSYDLVIRKNAFPILQFQKFIKILLYAYATVLFIQQIEVMVGIDAPFNIMSFGGRAENRFKLNSLSMEPSNLGVVLPCLMFCYMKVMEVLRGETKYLPGHIIKEDMMIWLLFLYASLTNGSMTSFYSVTVLFLFFVNRKNFKYIPIVVAILVGAIFFAAKLNPKLDDRIQSLFDIDYQSIQMIVDTDASSSVRIVPFILYFQSVGIDAETLFIGHGMDALEVQANLLILAPERIINNDRVGASSFINTFYDYGLVCGIIFLLFVIRNISLSFFSFETLFYFLVYMIFPMNHFVLWGFIFCMTTVLNYQKRFKQ